MHIFRTGLTSQVIWHHLHVSISIMSRVIDEKRIVTSCDLRWPSRDSQSRSSVAPRSSWMGWVVIRGVALGGVGGPDPPPHTHTHTFYNRGSTPRKFRVFQMLKKYCVICIRVCRQSQTSFPSDIPLHKTILIQKMWKKMRNLQKPWGPCDLKIMKMHGEVKKSISEKHIDWGPKIC